MKSRKLVAFLLSVVMLVGVFPIAASAAYGDYTSETHTVFRHTEQTLAPGIEQYTNYAYLNDGEQVVYYVTISDLSRDDVVAQVAYKDMQCDEYGLDKLSNMVAVANQKYADPTNPEFISENYKVVSATNGDGYNMQTGEPGGCFVMNYKVKKGYSGQFLAIMYDGSARMGYTKADWDSFEAENNGKGIKEAIDIFGSELVRNGVDVTANASGSYNTDRHSRTMIGITEDGKLINIVVDGRQSPFSDGASMHELAQIMLEAGAYNAFNLDGGGSTTYMMKPEGSDECVVYNRPSDGSERSISNGFIIASTATPSDQFDHAYVTASEEYVTPGSTFTVSAVGVSGSGDAADLPADLSYQMADTSFGTVTADGVVTLAEVIGDAVVEAVSGGRVVGSATVHVVNPDSFSFAAESFTAPFGKSIELGVTAKYGLNEVKLKPSDVIFTFDPEIGEMNGFEFTAPESSDVTSSTVTATLKWGSLTDTATLNLGKGSVVAFDFEDGSTVAFLRTNTANYNYILTPGKTNLVTAETGKVHSGNYAIAVHNRFDITTEAGYISGRLRLNDNDHDGYYDKLDLRGATRVGFWCYIPDEAAAFNGRIFWCKVTARDENDEITNLDGYYTSTLIDTGGNWNVGFNTQYSESNWHYIYANAPTDTDDWCLSNVFLDYYVNDRDNTNYNYNHLDYSGLNQNLTFYIDDLTIDYSSAVDDRDHPVPESITYAVTGMSDAAALSNGIVITDNTVSFAAKFSDYPAANTSGLNADSVKAYVDGKECTFAYNNGLVSISDVHLADGAHKVKFSIEDNMGNYNSIIRSFTVNAGTAERSVMVVPHSNNYGQILLGTVNGEEKYVPDCTELDKILLGSEYYVDVVPTDDIADIEKVIVDLDLNNNSEWELDHMVVAEGFEASYEIIDADDKLAEITITRTGETELTGQKFLVSIPTRTWELMDENGSFYYAAVGHPNAVWVYPHYKAGNETWPQEIRVKTERGEVTFTDATESTFSSDDVQVDTESYVWDNATKPADYATWNGGHDHNPGTGKFYVDQKKTVTTQVGDADPTSTTSSTKGWYGNVGTTTTSTTASDGTITTVTTTIENTKTYDNHVDAVAMDDVPATCTNPGVSGRTYCPVCGAVVTWGTELPTIAHNYEIVDGVLKCTTCGELFNGEYTDDKFYVDGIPAEGWIEDSYYVDGVKLTGVQLVDGLYYDFGEDGVNTGKYTGFLLVDGVNHFVKLGEYAGGWFSDDNGIWYYFDEDTKAPVASKTFTYEYGREVNYDFNEDGSVVSGKWVKIRELGTRYYYGPDYYHVTSARSGVVLWVGIDGCTYAFDGMGWRLEGMNFVNDSNNPRRLYQFSDDGALIGAFSGIYEGWYYEEGYTKGDVGLVQYEGDYYYVRSNGSLFVGKISIGEAKTNGLLPAGPYEFGEDYKMILNNGIVDGKYYVNNVLQKGVGLVLVDGDYYYVMSNGALYTGKISIGEAKTNGLLPAGPYEFGEDYKMILNNGIVDGKYYVNNVLQKGAGLVLVDGDYYYVMSNGALFVGKISIGEAKTNGLLPAGPYEFGEDYKMILKNGIVDGKYYVNNILQKGVGLVLVDGDYYYVMSNGALFVGKISIGPAKTNGLLPAGSYEFGADYKMIR